MTAAPLIYYHSDQWVFPAKEYLPDYTFYFDYFPNEWFKKTVKRYVRECLDIGKPKVQTLNRYNYSLRYFFRFLQESGIEVKTFKDINRKTLEMYIMYLLNRVTSPSSRTVIVASLKHVIKHGQRFEWPGFPDMNLFDETEFRTVAQKEDALKSMIITDSVMNQIKEALPKLQKGDDRDILIRCLIRICMDTGVRLSEALEIHEDSVVADLIGKPLLEVVSEKNETERYIAVSKGVVKAVETLKGHTKDARAKLGTNRLFVYYLPVKKHSDFLNQKIAREWLKDFIKRHNIRADGKLVHLTFHQFRHTLGTDMLNNGMTPYEVKEYLGHESMHSTSLYAKVRSDRLAREYKKLGFIGIITDKVENALDPANSNLDVDTRRLAALPDGVCSKPLTNEGTLCTKFNICLFCQKFITTPEYLPVHRSHLERLRGDKERYMMENFIGTVHYLNQIEEVLVNIISKLEELVVNG